MIFRNGLRTAVRGGMLALCWAGLTSAYAIEGERQIDQILARDQPPPGVLFETVTGDDDALETLLPRIQAWVERLNARFPDLPIAVVTHGREQFALEKTQQGVQAKVHSITRALGEQDVSLHVCGAYAGWDGLTREDFPDYVDFAASGPAQVNDYLALDYVLIKLTGD